MGALLLFQTYNRCKEFVYSIDFWDFFVFQWVLGSFCFGGVIPAQENNLASSCHVVFDKTTVCNICLLLLRVL